MRVLLVDAPTGLAERLTHEVVTLDDARDREVAGRAVADVDVVVCGLPAGSDALDRAGRGVFNLVSQASTRFVLLSSLRTFERYPLDHHVTEYWAPRPSTDPADLIALTAEGVVREAAHALSMAAVCLRLGNVVQDNGPSDPRAVHVDDVAQAVERALAFEAPRHGWFAFHVVGAGRTRFPLGFAAPELGYRPTHDVSGDAPLIAVEPRAPRRFRDQKGGLARRVVIFGAGGPLAAISVRALERDHVLRLCDLRPLAEIAADGKPQSRGAPVPRALEAPHEMRVVDVTDYDQVLEATRGMDAVINMTVMRHDPVEAFRVNTLGAYNVIRAAVECGIRRVVQTGPQQVTNAMPGGYWSDTDLSSSVPPRPGVELYFISKFLGHEIVRVFAQEHDLEAPLLVFGPFTNPEDCEPDQLGCYPFLVSWADAAEAVRGALRAPAFDKPFEVFPIVADLPHGRYQTDRTKAALHWQPRDSLDVHWRQHTG